MRDEINHSDPVTATRTAFAAVFATLVIRTACGPAFAMPAASDDDFLAELSTMVSD